VPPVEQELTHGDSILGHVLVTGCDNYWVLGTFRPGPDYPIIAPLLERVRQLCEADDDSWIDALEVINELGLASGGGRSATSKFLNQAGASSRTMTDFRDAVSRTRLPNKVLQQTIAVARFAHSGARC
jgi:hypothetical protein